eukprot:541032_1
MSFFTKKNRKLIIAGAVVTATAVIAYSYLNTKGRPTWDQKWKKFREKNELAPWENTYMNREMTYLSHFDNINPDSRTMNIFVPLCGASRDMIDMVEYFGKSRRIKLIGLEISCNAIEYFFDSKLKQPYIVETDESQNLKIYRSEDGIYELYAQSIFDKNVQKVLSERVKKIGFIDLVYDRAALNCIKPEQRREYISFMDTLLNDKGKIFLSTLRFNKMHSKAEYRNRSPYAFTHNELYNSFKPITNDKQKLKLLKSVKWSESEYDDEKSLGKRMGIDIENDGFCDIWSIEKSKL